MINQGWGRIINISTNHATMRREGFSPYGASKAALDSATVIWSKELDGTGVTVNSLRPSGPRGRECCRPGYPGDVRSIILEPEIMVPPLI